MRSLSVKIGLGYVVLIAVNISIAAFAIYHIDHLSQPIDQLFKEKYQNVSAAENMQQALQQMEAINRGLIEESTDMKSRIRFNDYKNEFLNWHQRAIEGVALAREPQILDSLSLILRVYQSRSDSLHELLVYRENYEKAEAFHASLIFPEVKRLSGLCTALKEINEQAIASSNNKAQQLSSRANLFIIIFAVGAIVLSILASIYLTHLILKPIRATTDTVKKIVKGSLNQKVEITSDDEIGELGLEFNKMTHRLAAYEKMNIREIIKEKSKVEHIVENIPVAVIVIDEKDRFSMMNDLAQEILALKNSSWQNEPVTKLLNDDKLIQFLKSGNPGDEEKGALQSLFAFDVNGSELFYFRHEVPIENSGGQPGAKIILLQDVTSFKKLDRLKSDFLATVSHELKTPMTSINMAVDILLRGLPGSLTGQQQELLTGVKTDCNRLRQFTRELLEIQKLESGRYAPEKKELDAADLINHALEPLKLQIDKKAIRLSLNIQPAISGFMGDFNQLGRVITNIVENAIEYTPQQGQIKIQVEPQNGLLQFCISDSGPGIAADAQSIIFDKFVRLEQDNNSQHHIGLGLAIVKEIIRAHDGTIWVKSKKEQGTQVYFNLPLGISAKSGE